jgi:thiol-disulfide isomerase/thioredoxin
MLGGCMQQHPQARGTAASSHDDGSVARQAARAQVAASAHRLELVLGQRRDSSSELEALTSLRIVGMDEGRVPDFELLASGGVQYSSKSLVGQQPFVAVFFATWCDYCKVELKTLERALAQVGPMLVIPVSADGSETWSQVPGYLASFGISQPAVRARAYPRFSVAYDPFDTVPALVIVGRNGGLVDYHLGYDPAHAERLAASLRLAKTIGPLGRP